MAGKNLIKEAIQPPLKEAGFQKKKENWYLQNEKVILLVNLQKSQYGDQYYLNFGVALKSFLSVTFPKEYQCHIRFRLNGIVPDQEQAAAASMFNLEERPCSDQQRKSEIQRLVNDYALSLLMECSTIDGLAKVVKSGKLANAMIHKLVKDLIDQSSEKGS